ncbi:MAG: hypothetical protein EZS28_021909, partial [Streblomastix strix]
PTNASASCTAVLVTLALMTSESLIHNPYQKAAVELYWLNISCISEKLIKLEEEQLKLISSVSLNDRDNIEGSDVGCADVEFYDDADDCVQREGSYK